MKAHYQCSECSKFFVKEGEEYVEVTEESLYLHNVSEVKAKDATCTEDGNKTYYKCTCEGCDKVYTKDEAGNLVETTLSDVTTKATGHTYGDWTFDEANLKITHTCKTCNHVETVAVNEANGFTYKVVTEPTSSSEGKATWTSAKYGTFTVTLPKVAGSNNTGLVVGISAGAAVVLIGGGTGLYFLLKKKH